jgi:hypothetical protein
MKQTVTESMFIDSFCGGYKDNFSYEGKKALFEYLEDIENCSGVEIELDPIAFCCEYTEYKNLDEFNREYGEECEEIDEVRELTAVITTGDESFIVLCY